jgi:hypothetical protein
MAEYDQFLKVQKNNPKFLYDYSPDFEYEGSFEIEFPKSKKFPHPEAISNYLEPLVEKIAGKDNYSVTYELNTKNENNPDQFTMTIEGSKKLFNNLKLPGFKNENWQPTVAEAYFFYKQ